MSSVQKLQLCAFLLAFVFGAAAQASRFCLHGGLREWVEQGSGSRLWTYVAGVGFALATVAMAQFAMQTVFTPVRPPSLSPQLPWGRYLVGGLLVGAGMMMVRGCPLRTTVKLAQGSAGALVAWVLMAASAYAFTRTSLFDTWMAPWLQPMTTDLKAFGLGSQGLDALVGAASLSGRAILGFGLGAVALVLAARRLPVARNRTAWIATALLGAAVAGGYALTGGSLGRAAMDDVSFMDQPIEGMGVQSITYAGPLSDAVNFVLRPGQQTFSIGLAILLGTLAGAFVSALVRREFKLQAPAGNLPKQIVGAVMTGTGAVIGLGCTVGNGVTGVSVLSLGALLSLAAMVVGALVVLRIEALLAGTAAKTAAA